MIDDEQVARELVLSLRGERSQRQLSRWLRYTTNVVYLWESGRRWPTGSAFLWLAHRVGVDVGAALDRLRPGAWQEGHAEPWHPHALAAWMRAVKGGSSAIELAGRMGRSRDAVGRWLRGEAEPRLPELLRFVEVASARRLDFVAAFVDPATMDATREAWTRLEAARRLTREHPWAPAVLLTLELADYQSRPVHSDAWVAARLGLDEPTVATCLALLVAAGQVRRVGEAWRREEVQAVDTRSAVSPWDLKRWWASVAADRMGSAQGVVSSTVCAVSAADFEALQALQQQHYRDLRARIAASTPGERVVLVNLHTLALDQPG